MYATYVCMYQRNLTQCISTVTHSGASGHTGGVGVLSTVEWLPLSQRLLMYNTLGGRSLVHCREVAPLSEVAGHTGGTEVLSIVERLSVQSKPVD